VTRSSHATHTGTLARSNDAATGPGCRAKPKQQKPFQPTLPVHLLPAAGNVDVSPLDPGSSR
jgi:hypothetical protein